jgi:signal transduction histidine kinase
LTNSGADSATIAALSARLLEAEADCAAKGAFIAAISRELNNPLSPVLLAVEHLRSLLHSGDAGRLEAAMALLERATEGFSRRTRLLLDLADLSAGTPLFVPARFDVSHAVAIAAAESAEMARLAGCEQVLDIAPGLEGLGNAEALSKVLAHILANAYRFGAGRPVRIDAAKAHSGACVITIADQGPGLAADQADSLFALFEQARAPLEPGLGIGLWVASRLVSAMGGTIGVQSSPGNGTHFRVTLAPHQSASVAPAPQNLQTL